MRRLFSHATIATMEDAALIADGAIVSDGGRIVWVGRMADLPATYRDAEEYDCGGRLVTPGLIDCHTHLIHGGDRSGEFEQRLEGVSYEEIARAGGGIVSSVKATRASSEDQLVASALSRLDRLIAEGVTTVEIKSGYGLDVASEIGMLAAARRLGRERDVRVRTSFLGAHALPPEYRADRAGYLRLVINEMLPTIAAAGLADAVDGFMEGIAFNGDEMSAVFDAARALGLPVKLHADQLSDTGGAALAARYGALSADHLEYTSEDGVRAMATSGTVAVILPGAFYFIRETRVPPIDLFRRHSVPMALATDCNPGTSPLTSLLLTMNMAATLFRMTVAECLAGVTRHAATALGLQDETGTITVGKACDLAIWDAGRPAELVYRLGFNPLFARIYKGNPTP